MYLVKAIDNFIQKYGTKGHSGRKKGLDYSLYGREPHRYVGVLVGAIPWGYGTTTEHKINEGSKNLAKLYRFFRNKKETVAMKKIGQAYRYLKNSNIEEAESKIKEVEKYLKNTYPVPKSNYKEPFPKIGGGYYS